MPHSPGALGDLASQIRSGFMQASTPGGGGGRGCCECTGLACAALLAGGDTQLTGMSPTLNLPPTVGRLLRAPRGCTRCRRRRCAAEQRASPPCAAYPSCRCGGRRRQRTAHAPPSVGQVAQPATIPSGLPCEMPPPLRPCAWHRHATPAAWTRPTNLYALPCTRAHSVARALVLKRMYDSPIPTPYPLCKTPSACYPPAICPA